MQIHIVPQPQHVQYGHGVFSQMEAPTFVMNGMIEHAEFLSAFMQRLIPGAVPAEAEDAIISLSLNPDLDVKAEGYVLTVSSEKLSIEAVDEPGLFYGLQTLRQLLPHTFEKPGAEFQGFTIPAVVIHDYPRFQWRGMHLDVSRHFFPVDFVKQYIDMIAFHKMNVFHWHLTDDNGWRLEIKKHPELTEVCAWRVDREHEDWRKWSPIQPGEKATYGGFYTQAEVREIITYAAERQITVIPEIEMPGHSSELFAAFPELSCRGEIIPVRPGSYWPNKDILCAGNEDVFHFLEDVIDEVVELFPAPYIHIGGDEATKTYWETCPKCQARIEAENLADEHELQSWFIQRMERYILKKGKRIIGWDEILEGGLAPEATVMSWRGEAGGIAAAKAGHDVIMTPTSHVYFDYYQGDPKTEPQAIGGYLPLRTVYEYEPVPKELSPEEVKFVLGSQANLWTEFVKTTEHAEYMVLPRMTALAEVVWTQAELKDFQSFYERLQKLIPRFEYQNWRVAPGSHIVEVLPGQVGDDFIEVEMKTEKLDLDLRYTLDGTEPHPEADLYSGKLSLNQDAQVKAALFRGAEKIGRTTGRDFAFHKALSATGDYEFHYSRWYTGGGDTGLLDGILGSENHKDGTWQGFQMNDLVLTVDLGEVAEIFKVEMNFLQSVKAWIWMPEYLEVKISEDGTSWIDVGQVDNEVPEKDEAIALHRLTVGFPTTTARYVKVHAKNRGTCPPWHSGAGDKAWIFTDELIVR